ncbi:MAG: TRAP transporter small permease [Deltaproteobacteria bacterium]|nr:TRAP transporter small permease [Deltaproteobacteria bacterium]
MFYRVLNKCIKILTILCLSVLTILVPIEVFLRYFFGKSLYITEEFTRYLMVWVVFLASSLAIKEDSHISIGIIVKRFQGRTRSWLNLIAQVLLLIFLIFLIIEGVIALSFQMDQIIPSLGLPIFWFYLAIPVGSSLMILNLLPKVWESFKIISGKAKSGRREESLSGNEPEGFL